MANVSEHAKRLTQKQNRYEHQIDRVKRSLCFTKSIVEAVLASAQNLTSEANSFVIYGEPQSGKTEMMICLVAKILDLDFKTVVVLVNDSIDLQNQNLRRFQSSGISPTPMSLSGILSSDLNVKKKESIVFCKKNSKDLKKLIDRLRGINSIVVIDDEADFATPNAKINKAEETKINELVKALRALGKPGAWIGVTATPARLDLNNTLENNIALLGSNFRHHEKEYAYVKFYCNEFLEEMLKRGEG
jgi:superfamily II DNA or RNA helicase